MPGLQTHCRLKNHRLGLRTNLREVVFIIVVTIVRVATTDTEEVIVSSQIDNEVSEKDLDSIRSR